MKFKKAKIFSKIVLVQNSALISEFISKDFKMVRKQTIMFSISQWSENFPAFTFKSNEKYNFFLNTI